MVREDTLYRILYSYFLERIFSVATGHINKLFSVVCIVLGLGATGSFFLNCWVNLLWYLY